MFSGMVIIVIGLISPPNDRRNVPKVKRSERSERQALNLQAPAPKAHISIKTYESAMVQPVPEPQGKGPLDSHPLLETSRPR